MKSIILAATLRMVCKGEDGELAGIRLEQWNGEEEIDLGDALKVEPAGFPGRLDMNHELSEGGV